MTTHAIASDATAAGDTTKTIVDTITLPLNTKRIIGVWGYSEGGAGETTLENRSGLLEFESPDIPIQPLQLPLDIVVVLTSGTAAFSPRVWPVDIPVNGQARISGYVTMDMAITVANKARFGVIVETN